MWWGKRQHTQPPADSREARELSALREEQADQLEQVRSRQPLVDDLTSRLIARRQVNHFGESIQVTFRRRNA